MSGRPLPSSFDGNDDFYNESGFQKVLRRIKEEPLVPIGCLLTVAAFTNAYRAMRRGDHNQVQRMFRARVAAQAFTVVAIVAGGMYYSADRNKQKELWKLEQQQDAEEKRQKWIKELEARDDEDKALQARLERRRQRAANRSAGTGTESVAAQARTAFKEAKEARDAVERSKAEETAVAASKEDLTSSQVSGNISK
ncbi:hypoxia induced protein conserved region-domain-containing protein [Lasiosphaeris hirsuta]|uniref:Hypoxia induced protein conserved region-domain-containing protein n=1 Tax=Lasiosphaeris hirsuta TaxID=260670 RepID=A0AA40AZ98_9PEZI|nr:hypoxia induced protein conserved region-domain-containing protein [Lasiosphaeris hirsuta]